jgi:hypothetical protein
MKVFMTFDAFWLALVVLITVPDVKLSGRLAANGKE